MSTPPVLGDDDTPGFRLGGEVNVNRDRVVMPRMVQPSSTYPNAASALPMRKFERSVRFNERKPARGHRIRPPATGPRPCGRPR